MRLVGCFGGLKDPVAAEFDHVGRTEAVQGSRSDDRLGLEGTIAWHFWTVRADDSYGPPWLLDGAMNG